MLVDRMVRDNNNQESALEVVTAGSATPPAPGYPPLVFQFPEGDFKFNFKREPATIDVLNVVLLSCTRGHMFTCFGRLP